ncbi:MAG TPA: hypothetical protein VF623_05150, partial [Segetibacter sp.]
MGAFYKTLWVGVMNDVKQLVKQVFANNNITVAANRTSLFDKFLQDEQNLAIVNVIIENQNQLMEKWKEQQRIAEITQQPVRILNATVGKP